MQPKADYFDDLVDRNMLTNFRDTAKEPNMQENVFISFLMNKKYIYRDKRGQLKPYDGIKSGAVRFPIYNKQRAFIRVEQV